MAEKQLTKGATIMLGDYHKALVAMAVPIFVSLLITQANAFIDTVWCSVMGAEAITAVSTVALYYSILCGIGNGFGIAASAVISSCIARKDKDGADRASCQTLVLTLIGGIASTLVLLAVGNLVLRYTTGEAYDLSVEYALPIYLLASVFTVQGAAVGILRGEGAAGRSMLVVSLAAVFNIVLDPVFAFVLGWGIQGLAWATVASTTLSLAAFFWWYLFRPSTTYVDLHRDAFRLDRRTLSEISAIAVPKTLEYDVMYGMAFPICYFLVVCGGSDAVAVYNTAWRFTDLVQIPSNAFAAALIPICSVSYARKDPARVRAVYMHALKLAVGITLVLGALVFVFSDYCAAMFTFSDGSSRLMRPLSDATRIFMFLSVFFSGLTVGSSFMQALRRSNCSMWSTIIRNIVLIATIGVLSTTTLNMIWWGYTAVELFGMVLMCGWAEVIFRGFRKSC